MSETIKHIRDGLKNSYSYTEYEQLIEDLLAEGKSTTKEAREAAEDFVRFSKLGLQRMKRWDKKFELAPEQKEVVQNYNKKRTWIVLAEGWCGDAAHIVPIIHKITKLN